MRGESRRMTKKKITERKKFPKKIVHREYRRKKESCIDLPKYFTEILAMRTREQIGVKSSVVKTCLHSWLPCRADFYSKRHFNQQIFYLFIYLFTSFATVNQHSEEIITTIIII